MACKFDVADISRVVLRVDIVVLQEALSTEIVDKALVLVMFMDGAVFVLIDLSRDKR